MKIFTMTFFPKTKSWGHFFYPPAFTANVSAVKAGVAQLITLVVITVFVIITACSDYLQYMLINFIKDASLGLVIRGVDLLIY